jgi:hypothetical protein
LTFHLSVLWVEQGADCEKFAFHKGFQLIPAFALSQLPAGSFKSHAFFVEKPLDGFKEPQVGLGIDALAFGRADGFERREFRFPEAQYERL